MPRTRNLPAAKFFFLPLILVLISPWFFPPAAGARTIALVYDDSGSMLKADRYLFANYASQTLVGLLRRGDTFRAVLMSAPDTVQSFDLTDPESRGKSIETIYSGWKKPVEKSPTPYLAVKTAMEAILAGGQPPPSTALEQKQDWLIITTDGEIDCRGLDPDEITRDLRRLISEDAERHGRTVRIVFILIGKQVNRDFADLWQQTAPAHVERIFQVTPEKLAATMETVASLIAGRDQEPLAVSIRGNDVTFSSAFPLSRITLFQQTAGREPARITAITGGGRRLNGRREFFTMLSPPGTKTKLKAGAFRAAVSHVTAGNNTGLPPGTYILTCDRAPDRRTTRVFIDAAVDFSVELLDARGTPLPGRNPVLNRCRDEKLALKIGFHNPLTGRPLALDDRTASHMSVTAMIDRQTISFRYDPGRHRFPPVVFTVREGRQYISCQARSPAYFNLKSKIFTIDGQICERPWAVEITPSEVTVPFIDRDQPTPVSGFASPPNLRFRYRGKETPEAIKGCRLTAVNLPAGVQLEIAGQILTAARNETSLPEISNGTSLPWSLSRTREFSPRQETKVELQLTPADPTIKWSQPLALTIKPGQRSVAIEAADPAWHVPVTRLGNNHPYGISITVDGRPLSPGELSKWHFTAEPERRLKCELVPAAAAGRTLDLVPRQYLIFPCFTSMGEQRIRFRAQGPFPGDVAEQELLLRVGAVPWWRRCSSLALTLALLLLTTWYIIGLLKKPRFTRKGKIVVQPLVDGRKEGREKAYALAAPPLKRYLVPYLPERRTIRGITFIPGPSGSMIYLRKPSARLRQRTRIDGLPLSDDRRDDIPLTRGATMTLEAAGGQAYEIGYQN